MDAGAYGPDVVLFRHERDFGPAPLVSSDSIVGLFAQGRQAEISQHEVRDGVSTHEFAGEENVFGLDVAMDNSSPVWRWGVGISCEAVIAIVKKSDGIGKLDEALPQKSLGNTAPAASGD